jgi:hypothetical protein
MDLAESPPRFVVAPAAETAIALGNTAVWFDLRTGRRRELDTSGATGRPSDAVFTEDGERLAVAFIDGMQFYDRRGERIRSVHAELASGPRSISARGPHWVSAWVSRQWFQVERWTEHDVAVVNRSRPWELAPDSSPWRPRFSSDGSIAWSEGYGGRPGLSTDEQLRVVPGRAFPNDCEGPKARWSATLWKGDLSLLRTSDGERLRIWVAQGELLAKRFDAKTDLGRLATTARYRALAEEPRSAPGLLADFVAGMGPP